jgi:hypothetical protein
LAQFQNNWATAELAKQYLSNHHKAEVQKRKRAQVSNKRSKRPHHIDDLSKNEEDDENEIEEDLEEDENNKELETDAGGAD